MIDYSNLIDEMSQSDLAAWAKVLPQQIESGLSHGRYGDLKDWMKALDSVPESLQTRDFDLKKEVRIGSQDKSNKDDIARLELALKDLIPWRKGPFKLYDINLNTEWRSDWKWDRLTPHIGSLENKKVLDVGCGNGYHCLRMLGAGAQRVLGIDPSPRFIVQFYLLKKLMGAIPVDILPVGIEAVPENLAAFDSCFSMGVLYHRRSPMDHLKQLMSCLKPGGELILETLVIDGPLGATLVPEGRYAKMNNVWFLPSPDTLISWLNKCGFADSRCVDINITSKEEQRVTPWMTFQSLEDFLDPHDENLTIEGHPAPKRGIFIARKKS